MKNLMRTIFWAMTLCLALNIATVHPLQAEPSNYKESDFSKEDLDLSGLNEVQKALVLKILNNNNCTCGCAEDTWAHCIKTDIKCSTSRELAKNVARLAKDGRSEDFILGFLAGWKEGGQKAKKGSDDPNKIYPVSTMNAPFKGLKDAPVTIILYTDYQCPFCKTVEATLKSLLAEYPDKIRWYVMNNPLAFHKNAMAAALATRAAERQGKFWEMRDLIFENPAALDDANLVKIAEKLGLNLEKFNADRQDEWLKAEILKEQKQAVENGATGTPALFINGKKFGGAKPLAELKKAVEEALNAPKTGAEVK